MCVMCIMRKLIQIQENTHKGLKLYIVRNDLKTFDDGISDLLSKMNYRK